MTIRTRLQRMWAMYRVTHTPEWYIQPRMFNCFFKHLINLLRAIVTRHGQCCPIPMWTMQLSRKGFATTNASPPPPPGPEENWSRWLPQFLLFV